MKKSELVLGNLVKRNKGEEEFVITSINEDVVTLNGKKEVKTSTFLRSYKLIAAVENKNFMTIKDYVNNHNFRLMNENHKGVNREFKSIRKSSLTHLCEYIIFDEKFALKKMNDNVYKLVDFCGFEKFNKQIDEILYKFDNEFFEVEMLDKNDEHYIVQFNRNDDNINGNSILRVYKRSGMRMPISNPYGPAFVRYENHKIVETKFYLLGEEKSEFEIEVLKAATV